MSGGVGFYGKLPGVGDFVRRRLPSDFVDGWDRHFQRALDTGRRECGEQWASAWRQGPAWRFVLPPQVCGESAWCGVTGPATDRLGRAFPLVLAAPCTGEPARLVGDDAWFDALERVYWSAQQASVSVGMLDARVAALPAPFDAAGGAHDRRARWRDLPWDSGQWHLTLPGGTAAGLVLAEAWRHLGTRPEPWCLWWTEGAARLLATRGLPRSYAALLDLPQPPRELGAGLSDGPDFGTDFGPDIGTDFGPIDVPDDAFDNHAVDGPADPPADAHPHGLPPRPSHGATETIRSDWLADDAPASALGALLQLDEGRTLVLSADEGPFDARRVAAHAIREAVAASPSDHAGLRARLTSLHARLRDASHRTVDENGAALVVRVDGASAYLLRVGAAALWHWRHGRLQALFVERAAGAGGEFDDLLFGDAWLDMPGVGTPGELDGDEAVLRLEPGDRLAMLVTRALTQLPRDCLAEALALPTCDDARSHLARRAGLGASPARWPLAVVEVRV